MSSDAVCMETLENFVILLILVHVMHSYLLIVLVLLNEKLSHDIQKAKHDGLLYFVVV